MTPLKINRAFAIAKNHGVWGGPETRKHILRQVTESISGEVLASLSSVQLAALIVAVRYSYHEGLEEARKMNGVPQQHNALVTAVAGA